MGIFFPFSHAQERRGVGAEPPAAVATCQEHRAGSLQSGQQLFGTDEDAVRQRGPESDALGSADAQEGQVQGRQGRLKWCGYHEAISVTHSSYCSPSSRSAMPANLFTCFFCFLQKNRKKSFCLSFRPRNRVRHNSNESWQHFRPLLEGSLVLRNGIVG